MASKSEKNEKSENGSGPQARLILQQCLSARLMVQPATEEEEAQYVEVSRGLVVYVCFLKGATSSLLEKMVKCVTQTRLSETNSGKLTSICELPGDILIIPQATLGGRLKGRLMQYHYNVDKTLGQELYANFVDMCRQTLEGHTLAHEAGVTAKCGTYGNRQVLSIDTNGPYTHLVEF